MARKALVVCVIAAAIVALLLAAVALRQGSVSAQPIAGATYTGTVSVGGTVSLTVSADGTEVTQYTYTITADGCAASGAAAGAEIPIQNDEFVDETDGRSFSGSFPSAGAAEGTIVTELSPPCDSVTWTATTAVPSPTPTPSPTASPTPTRAVNIPARSWANFAWTGDGSPSAQEVANCYNDETIAVMYRLDAETHVFERWIRGREGLSTMGDVAQFDVLLALNASDELATCTMPDPSAVPARTLTIPAQSWANFSWTGDSSPQEMAGCFGEGNIAVMYRLDAETQVFERWIRDREGLSTMGDVAQFDALLALNASDQPAICQMPGGAEAPPTPTPSPTPTPTAAATGGPPTEYLDTFHAAFDMSMEMDSFEMDFDIEGDFEATNRCSCDISASMLGIPLIDQRLIVIGSKAWIDTGDGWRKTTPSDPEVAEAVGMCPACPSFWEDFAFEAPPLPGEHEDKNGVPAIHYTLGELYEAFAGIGLIPEELEGVSIDVLDVWVAEEGKWLVCLDMEMCVDAEMMEEFTGSLGEVESVCMAMTIDITRVNDPGIEVNAP